MISHDAMWQITAGLEPLVESCTHMMAALMGVPMHNNEHHDNWDERPSLEEYCHEHPDDEDCQWEEDDEWDDDEEESNIPDEDEEEQRDG